MSTRTWANPGTTGNWSTVTNWSPLGAPAAGDDVVIPAATAGSQTGVNLDVSATPALDSVTVGGTTGFAFLNVGQNTLNVTGTGPGATDTVTFALPGSGPISSIAGGTIVARNLMFSGGFFEGFGTLAISGMISGSGEINADGLRPRGQPVTGGTLSVSGTVETGVHLTITPAVANNTALSVLEILGTATSSIAINVFAYQMLEIGPSGGVTINAAETIGSNITLEGPGSRLVLGANPLTIYNIGTLSGQGTVNASTISGAGTVAAVGGTLALTQNVGPSTGLNFEIGTASCLQLDGTVGAANAFTFIDAGQASLGLGNDAGFNGTVSKMNVGAANSITNFVDIEGHTATIVSQTGHGTNSGTVSLSDGAVLNLVNLNSTAWVASTGSDGAGGTDVFVSAAAVCFCRGTMILTERGEVAVEELAVGDRVHTLSGAMKPIVWIGCGRELVTRANKLARPIIVRRGALADEVPHRDLYLTHGHALYFDGALIPVEHLVNHASIAWDETARVIEYYHIELEDHDVVFAEGAPTETYYDADNRAFFQNIRRGSEAGGAKPTFAPVLHDGDLVAKVWTQLYERAGGGFAAETTDDPDLHLVIAGARLDPASIADGVFTFAIDRAPSGPLMLRSRSGVPSLLGRSRHEHRRLGVAIRQLILQGAGVMTCIDYDAPLFRAAGCHAPDDGHSWSDGELALSAGLFAPLSGHFNVIVHTKPQDMRYPVVPGIEAAASANSNLVSVTPNGPGQKENWPEPSPAKFEQGGFTSRRRKGP